MGARLLGKTLTRGVVWNEFIGEALIRALSLPP
jgi:hypothetical protein